MLVSLWFGKIFFYLFLLRFRFHFQYVSFPFFLIVIDVSSYSWSDIFDFQIFLKNLICSIYDFLFLHSSSIPMVWICSKFLTTILLLQSVLFGISMFCFLSPNIWSILFCPVIPFTIFWTSYIHCKLFNVFLPALLPC